MTIPSTPNATMRWPIVLRVIAVTAVGCSPALAQEPPLPPSDTSGYRLVATQAGPNAKAAEAGAVRVRARLRTSDGRILVARDGGVAWLADSARTQNDSTDFTIALTPGQSTGAMIVDARGRCLNATSRESSIPLGFGPCDRGSLAIYPPPDPNIMAGRAGFWLLTSIGRVGPTPASPLLMPRSAMKTWFRLDPIR